MLQVHCFGDSITYGQNDNLNGGWCNMLKLFLQDYHFKTSRMYSLVYNHGIPGATVRNLKDSCKFKIQEALEGEPMMSKMISVISFGANDCRLAETTKEEFMISKQDFVKELTRTCNYLGKINSSILIQNITPILEPVHWGDYQDLNRKNLYIQQYNEIIEYICSKNEVKLVDTHSKFENREKELLSEDGLHPSTQGHKVIFETIKLEILELIKDL
jgi:lysophospholipase L1-like esterase